MEYWKIIKQFPEYEISTYGRVRKIKTQKCLYIKHHSRGYLQVVIQSNDKKHYLYIHRLVAQAFIPNPQSLPFVNHKDEDKQNNHVDNLEWCTCEYNTNYGTAPKRNGLAHHKKVRQYTKSGQFIKEWDCYQEAEKALNLPSGLISKYVNSPYHWEKVE